MVKDHMLTREMNTFSTTLDIAEQPCDDRAPEFLTYLQNTYGFLNALMGSSATNSIFTNQGGKRVYRSVRENCDTGEREIVLGKTIWTELPDDIGIACCHTKPDVNGCLTVATPARLCLRDCFDDMTEHFRRLSNMGFSLFGGSTAESEYMAELRAWFVFFQARDIMYGQVGVTGNNIPSFPGVLDLMNKAVVSFSGTDVIGAFEQIGCRLALLKGNYVMGAHPMTVRSLEKAVVRGGVYYNGWSKQNGQLTYEGIPIVPDINIPLNLADGTGQVWAADLNKVGVFMEYNLTNPEEQRIDQYTDSTTNECFSSCIMLKNYGFAFTKDYNALFRITDVPLDGACLGENVLLGLGGLIDPETLYPTYE